MKACNKCGIEKGLDEFFKDKNHSTGRYSICKSCKKESTYRWRTENRRVYNAVARKWRADHKDRVREYNLRKKGINTKQYQALFDLQLGCCAICGRSQIKCKRRLSVDHCHRTGKIRSLLCSNCNKGLGNFQESAAILKRASEYLFQHKKE